LRAIVEVPVIYKLLPLAGSNCYRFSLAGTNCDPLSLVVNIFMLYTEEGSDYSHIHLRPVVELPVIIKLLSLAGTNCDPLSLAVNIFMLYTEEGSDYSHIRLRAVVEVTNCHQ
jgi:hypothetical protein